MKRNSMESEKIIFSAILVAIGLFVISLFFSTMIHFGSGDQADYLLRTQVVENSSEYPTTTSTASNRGSAQTLILVGAMAFSFLGGVIFLGLKVNDRYN